MLEHKLFDCIKEYTLSSGGDGHGIIVSINYKTLASKFEAYELTKGNWFNEKTITETSISFCHGQEGITFTSDNNFPFEEIVVYVN